MLVSIRESEETEPEYFILSHSRPTRRGLHGTL